MVLRLLSKFGPLGILLLALPDIWDEDEFVTGLIFWEEEESFSWKFKKEKQ